MARKRKPRQKPSEPRKTDITSEISATATTTTKGSEIKMGLTPEQVRALMAGARTKGQYVEKLNEFLVSGQNGVLVTDEWEEFEGRKTATIKQGFDNARDHKNAAEGSDKVKAIVSDDKVYLINLALSGEQEPEED